MPKFIVDAPEIKKGQVPSSGGIRCNGKLVAQYTNPTPYTDPKLQTALIPVKEQQDIPFSVKHPTIAALGDELKDDLKDACYDLLRDEIIPYCISRFKSFIRSLFTSTKEKTVVIETTYTTENEENDSTAPNTPIITVTKTG